MTVLYEPLARQELADAVAYYKAISPDLADRLLDAEEAAIRRIEQLPNAWPPLKGGLRRCILDVFPYQIIYRVEA